MQAPNIKRPVLKPRQPAPQPVRIRYVPRWEGAIKGHAVNTVRSFYAGMHAEYEFNDLMQEAYIVYMMVKKNFRDTPDNPVNPKWFMSLYSMSLRNKLINIKARCGRYSLIDNFDDFDVLKTNPDENFLKLLLQELPDEVKALIDCFCFGTGKASKVAHKQLKLLFPDVV